MDNIIRCHIRGQMGVQILQACTAISTINDNEEPIINVNSGGLTQNTTNKLDLVFTTKCRIIDINDATRKTPYWVPGSATQIMKNRTKIFRWLEPKVLGYPAMHQAGVHIRGNDKRVASRESYRKLYDTALEKYPMVKVFTDDEEFAKDIYNISHHKDIGPLTISEHDATEDWYEMLNSTAIYSAPSAFIMSMLIFNPEKRITFLSEELCDGDYPAVVNDLLFLRELMEFCPNVTFIE